MGRLRNIIASFLHPHGKVAFLQSLTNQPKILDVGCGNDSVIRIKNVLPQCRYMGIDIDDYNLSTAAIQCMDSYVKLHSDKFAEGIVSLNNQFDCVISWHNLEHCNDRDATLAAMANVVKIGGKISLSFPCEESVNFPKRRGTLNYYDDLTHQGGPPNFSTVMETLRSAGFRIDFSRQRYRPVLLKITGFFTEPFSRAQEKLSVGTWAYYGFESVITATKTRMVPAFVQTEQPV